MVDYIVTSTLGEAQSIVAKIDALLGLPDKQNKTVTYAIPQEHETNRGQYLVIIKSVASRKTEMQSAVQQILDSLSAADKTTIKSRETLEAEGAFPKDVDLGV